MIFDNCSVFKFSLDTQYTYLFTVQYPFSVQIYVLGVLLFLKLQGSNPIKLFQFNL